jgi:hypothetical protein
MAPWLEVLKEGGKRGVEIEGAADMGGLQRPGFIGSTVTYPAWSTFTLNELERSTIFNGKSHFFNGHFQVRKL